MTPRQSSDVWVFFLWFCPDCNKTQVRSDLKFVQFVQNIFLFEVKLSIKCKSSRVLR